MQTLDAIAARRSIRRFKPDPLTREQITAILHAGTLAPSSKNGQPWRFVVVGGPHKQPMLDAMRTGMDVEKQGKGYFGEDGPGIIRWAEYTWDIMHQAPITVFIYSTIPFPLETAHIQTAQFTAFSQVQSVSAAIQNMLLAAEDMGIGSLWICDIFFAYDALQQHLGVEGQLLAAVSFGYADEAPGPRGRRPVDDVTDWRME